MDNDSSASSTCKQQDFLKWMINFDGIDCDISVYLALFERKMSAINSVK